MAAAYNCDLCGEYYSRYDTARVSLCRSKSSEVVKKIYDICPKCEKAFRQWVVSRQPNERTAFEDKEDA